MTIKLLSSKEQIAGQDKLRANILSVDTEVHKWAVQAMLHAEKHGDASLMRRLLVDIVDAKTGYRRQGLINWMRTYSPMELKGTDINLSGLDAKGEKRPFQVEKANDEPFWTNANNAEKVAKPVFRDNAISKFQAGVREIYALIANTSPEGKPIDTQKPYLVYDRPDELKGLAEAVETQVNKLTSKADLSKMRADAKAAADKVKQAEEANKIVETAEVAAA